MPAPRRAIPNRKPPVRAVRDAAVALEALLHQHHAALLDPESTALLRRALRALRDPDLIERAQAQERLEAEAIAQAQSALQARRRD
jgi:hypothetical protein